MAHIRLITSFDPYYCDSCGHQDRTEIQLEVDGEVLTTLVSDTHFGPNDAEDTPRALLLALKALGHTVEVIDV